MAELTPITQYSQVQFDNPPVFAGRLLASTSGGFRPPASASFTVLSYPSAIGGFSPLNSIDLGSGLSLTPQFLPTSLVLTAVQGATLPSLAVTRFPDTLRITLPDGYSDWRLFSATNIANPYGSWASHAGHNSGSAHSQAPGILQVARTVASGGRAP